jgi:two-component system response regulator MtrA
MNVSKIILVIDGDDAHSETLKSLLESAGFATSFCHSGAKALESFTSTNPDLVLLDLNLSDVDGLEVFRTIRTLSAVPIIILTERNNSDDIVQLLELGADDFIQKPWRSNDELLARIKSRMRPVDLMNSTELKISDITIELIGHRVRRGTNVIPLTGLEFKILTALAKQPTKVFTREALLEEVWDYRDSADTRLVNVHIQRLRAKVELDPDKPEVIITIRGAGYKAGPI